MRFRQAEEITNGRIIQHRHDSEVIHLLTDTRKIVPGPESLFFAIPGERNDGHTFLDEAYGKGVRQFIVEKTPAAGTLPEANILQVGSSLAALQAIACRHRDQFHYPVIGVTGSNGKTIVKEWLSQLLSREYAVVKNPGSYNSQVGVPLSVWKMGSYHQLGIFEAGISRPGEMENLQRIIQPSIGIFTNIGPAHDEGFPDIKTKIEEKSKLFSGCEKIVCCQQHKTIVSILREKRYPVYTWGTDSAADVFIEKSNAGYQVRTTEHQFDIELPFEDAASVENCFHCLAVMLILGYAPEQIRERMPLLRGIAMRLELKEGINHCLLIDDSYNNDLAGLRISLDFLMHQKQRSIRRLILSDILQSGLSDELLATQIAELVNSYALDAFVGIGPVLSLHQDNFRIPSAFFTSTDEFLAQDQLTKFQNEVILIKGARSFHFEKIVTALQRRVHGTVLEIDLDALVGNLNWFRSRISSHTKLMVMVKAFAYGSGSVEIANVLQFHHVDYLGVAYADEGIDLRKNNISLPVMVMNPSPDSFGQMIQFNLEPEIYSIPLLREFARQAQGRPFKIHLKLETGMNRLGLPEPELPMLIDLLKQHPGLRVASIFSHLAGADDPIHDEYSRTQAKRFQRLADRISSAIGYKPLYHLLNSAGILRLSEWQFDMVRLGIGLYGIDPGATGSPLQPVATLKTIISQIRSVPTGTTVGYGRKGSAGHDMTVATLAIGYADGFSRRFSDRIGEVLINGHRAPVVGSVCMDMTMVDITGIPALEGDEAIIYGNNPPIEELAQKINTIPYEILTQTSERVKRVFYAASI